MHLLCLCFTSASNPAVFTGGGSSGGWVVGVGAMVGGGVYGIPNRDILFSKAIAPFEGV